MYEPREERFYRNVNGSFIEGFENNFYDGTPKSYVDVSTSSFASAKITIPLDEINIKGMKKLSDTYPLRIVPGTSEGEQFGENYSFVECAHDITLGFSPTYVEIARKAYFTEHTEKTLDQFLNLLEEIAPYYFHNSDKF